MQLESNFSDGFDNFNSDTHAVDGNHNRSVVAWNRRISKFGCDGFGFEYIPYNTELLVDNELTDAWNAIKDVAEDGLCGKKNLVKPLIQAIENYMLKYLGLAINTHGTVNVRLAMTNFGPNRGIAWVGNRDCIEAAKEEIEDAAYEGRNPEGPICATKQQPLKVYLNLWDKTGECLFFKYLPDPRQIIAVLVHEYYHVHQTIDCWQSDAGDSLHEFQATLDEYRRWEAYSGFIPKVPKGYESRFLSLHYGLSWRLFAWKFADYFEKTLEQVDSRQKKNLSRKYREVILQLCHYGVPIDDTVWEADPALANFDSDRELNCPGNL